MSIPQVDGLSTDPREMGRHIKRLKNICSNLPKLRLPNENDNLILQTDALDKYWATILKTYLGEICHYTSVTFNDN